MKKIMLTGNLGKDPEMRTSPNGEQFATFTLAVSVGTKQNPKTDWVDVSCNGKLADVVCTYIKKGTKVLVSGFPSVSAYLNKENQAVGSLRVYADDIEFLSPKANSDNSIETSDVYTLPQTNTDTLHGDNIPF